MSSSGAPPHNGDENRQGGILATTFVVTVIASIAVALRMWVRLAIVKKVGWDDYTIIAATVCIFDNERHAELTSNSWVSSSAVVWLSCKFTTVSVDISFT